VTAPVAERPGRQARQRGQGIGRAAVMIGVITLLARLAGFGRQVVFAHSVGTTCLGTAYTTANMVPNIVYDIILGGALASVVVPVLALGTSIGLTVAGIALLVLVGRERGGAALTGVPRAFFAGLAGCAAGAAAGSAVAAVVPVSGFFPNVGISVLVTAVVTAVFAAVVINLDGGDLRTAFIRLRTRVSAGEA